MAMTKFLLLRDHEILRTLARLRFVTTAELIRAFFGAPQVGRRRLAKLRDRNLIRPHTKGLPPRVQYSAWRLTAPGIDAVREAFPSEILPEGLDEQLTWTSLYNIEHREAVSDVYFRFLLGGCASEDDPDGAARARIMRERA